MGEHGVPFGDGSGGAPWHGAWPVPVPGGHLSSGAEHYLPLLLMAVLIGVIVWAILRTTRTQVGVATIPVSSAGDGASQELRLRYARGDIDRATFLTAARDLGDDVPAPEADAGPRAGSQERSE